MLKDGLENYWRNTKYRLPEDPVVREFVLPKLDIIRKYITVEGMSILDLGCGNGTFMYYFSSLKEVKITGVDISDVMLSKNKLSNLIKASADKLPFKDNSFDLVFEANLLHHAFYPQKVVAEMQRVAKTHIALIEPNRLNPIMFLFSLFNKAERGGLKSSKNYIFSLLEKASLTLIYMTNQGLITQNNTPEFLIPLLKSLENKFLCGAYIITIAKKQ